MSRVDAPSWGDYLKLKLGHVLKQRLLETVKGDVAQPTHSNPISRLNLLPCPIRRCLHPPPSISYCRPNPQRGTIMFWRPKDETGDSHSHSTVRCRHVQKVVGTNVVCSFYRAWRLCRCDEQGQF